MEKMVRTLSRMSDISVKLIVKRGFIVCIIRKSIRYIAPRYKNKKACNANWYNWKAESKKEKKKEEGKSKKISSVK